MTQIPPLNHLLGQITSSPSLMWLAGLLLLAVIAAAFLLSGKGSRRGLFNKKALLTGNELEFFGRLRRALPEYHILTQVSMGAILQPSARVSKNRRLAVRGMFAQKIIDFVVADKQMNVIALIELDDRTHDRRRDGDRDAMTRDAGYITHRWQSKNKPDEAEIRKTVLSR